MSENKMLFVEPECEIVTLTVVDVVTASPVDDPDWGMGEF